MKRTTALAIAGLLAALTLPTVAVAAWAEEGDCTTPYTTTVSDRPDSGLHGTWAHDTFERVTDVCKNDDGTWTVTLTDSGSFTTIAGAQSPGDQNVPLPAEQITGDFEGAAMLIVTADTAPHAPVKPADGWPSSSQWPSTMWDSGATTPGAFGWAWNYTTDCESWTNAQAGNSGDITKVCEVVTPPTTTVPPTTTTPPTSGASAPPTSSTGSIPPTTDETPASSSSKTPAVHYADSANTKGDSGDLAYTGTSASLLWVVLAAVVLLGGGGALLYVTRRRRAAGGTHRR